MGGGILDVILLSKWEKNVIIKYTVCTVYKVKAGD